MASEALDTLRAGERSGERFLISRGNRIAMTELLKLPVAWVSAQSQF